MLDVASLLLTTLLLCLSFVSSVKRSDFKTCEQSNFCKKHRDLSSEHSAWSADDIKWDSSNHSVSFTLTAKSTILEARLDFLDGSAAGAIVRCVVDEPAMMSSSEKRYRIPIGVIVATDIAPDPQAFLHEQKNNLTSINFGQDNFTIFIRSFPFSLVVEGADGNCVWSMEGDDMLSMINGKRFMAKLRSSMEAKLMGQEVDSSLSDREGANNTATSPNGDYNQNSIAARFQFHEFKHIYGIPLHASNFSLKETRATNGTNVSDPYRLYNLDVFEYELGSPMALYGSIPFMTAQKLGQSAGLFWNNPSETWIDVTKKHNSISTRWISNSGVIDFYLMLANGEKASKSILSLYTRLTGLPMMPPLFALGYHQCRWNYQDDADVRAINAAFDENHMPNDVIWLDIEHTDEKKYFTWNKRLFPDPITLQNYIGMHGRKMVIIVDPHLKKDDSYSVYKDALDNDMLVKQEAAGPFEGQCWPGISVWPDFTDPKVRRWWADKFSFGNHVDATEHLYIWNDMNEPSVFGGSEITMPTNLMHYNGVAHHDIHNLYGHYMHRATYKGMRKRNNKRPFVLSRSFYAGSQKYGAIWTGDNAATWEHLAATIPMLLSLSMAGLPFVGADIGGFFGDPDPELAVRWYQAGAMQPFFRGHAHIDTKRREPWLFGEPYTSIIRAALHLRYSLLPYWYTIFREAATSGIPMMRPMYMEFPHEEAAYETEDQHMVGPSLLFKPIVHSNANAVSVFFPASSEWFDYLSHEPIKQAETELARRSTNLEMVPLFVRAGSIIISRDRPRRSSAAMKNDPLTVTVFVDQNSKANGQIYLDDGESYEYEKGAFIESAIMFQNNTLRCERTGGLDHENSKIGSTAIERIVFVGLSKMPASIRSAESTHLDFERRNNGDIIVKLPNVRLSENWDIALSIETRTCCTASNSDWDL